MQTNLQKLKKLAESADAPIAKDEPVVSEATGVVTDCLKLNVRKAPNADAEIVSVIPALTEVTINPEESTNEFYKICTADGICGFCMKKYIAVRR